jgi:hypothetical protein
MTVALIRLVRSGVEQGERQFGTIDAADTYAVLSRTGAGIGKFPDTL